MDPNHHQQSVEIIADLGVSVTSAASIDTNSERKRTQSTSAANPVVTTTGVGAPLTPSAIG